MNMSRHRAVHVDVRCTRPSTGRDRHGVTLLELLVVVGILAIVIGLLMPATQAAREAARRLQCANHLRNLGIGCLHHESTHKHFPSDGWGFRWVGDPDRGVGPSQPGGWAYNVLPYIDQQTVWSIGAGLPPSEKRAALARLLQQPIAMLNCPSRREATAYAYTESRYGLVNANGPRNAAKSDYAINAGTHSLDGGFGPKSDSDSQYRWPSLEFMNGISFVRSSIRVQDIVDGTSRTIMIGEKFVPQRDYTTGTMMGDDQGMFIGDDADIRRYSELPPIPDVTMVRGFGFVHAFGSAHPSSAQFVFCDGSVQRIAYAVDQRAFQLMGARNDGANAYRRRAP